MDKKIAVLAPGGVGGPVGGLLTKTGHDVVLIDQWPAHVDAMKANGLRITIGTKQEPEGEFVVPVRAYHLYEVCTLRQQFDIVFLTAKSYDTRWLVHFIEPYLKPDGMLVSMQNSLNDEWIAPIVGKHRDIACVLTGGGELLEPGHVWRNRSMQHPYYTLGELDGTVTPRLEELAKILSDAGKSMVSTDILAAKWTKLVANSQSSVAALCNERKWNLMDHPRFVPALAEITREAMQISLALGYRWEPLAGLTAESLLGDPERVVRNLIANTKRGSSKDAMNMVQHDMKVGRPTEVAGYLNGLLVKKGKEANVPTPFSPITLIAREPSILVVHPSLPTKSVKELIALAKARPGELNYSSTGNGGAPHLSMELFKSSAGVNIVRVPYTSSGALLYGVISAFTGS